ncbi:MAG: hypothetical protein IH831_04390 [Planctomycetes bacterium]|nr:hypothetical protein [Planctomycetota bacterium]
MTAPSTSTGTMVREATPADLADVVKLLSARDNQPRDPQVVCDYLWGLDPEFTRVWLAYVGDEPVGITMLYLRQMNWPADGNDTSQILAGYWAHLYVNPAFRKKMVYPQLVLAMLRGMNVAGIAVIFTATRQPQVAEGHQRLGFALVDKMPLRLRPLRPFRLTAKHKGASALAPLCAPLDALYGLAARRRTNRVVQIENVSLDSPQVNQPQVDEIVALLNSRPTVAVRQFWTAEQFRRRYHTTLDGTSYRIRAVRHGERLAAVLVMTIAERGNQIRAGILLELATEPDATAAEIDALLADAENFAHREGAEVMLSLEGSLSLEQLAGSFGKYLVNRSEVYHLLVYPKPMAQAPHLAAELAHWTFAFADHDAF